MMVKTEFKNNKKIYRCEACGFHYLDKDKAGKCEEWCIKHQSCNLEIIQSSLERQKSYLKRGGEK